LGIYRSPRGDFTNFLKWLDLILQKCHNKKYNIVICGGVNVNYLLDNNRRSQLDAVLLSYNLAGIVEFSTKFGLNSQTAINRIFIDIHLWKIDLYPLINGLSDHEAQLLILNKGGEKKKRKRMSYLHQKKNQYTIADFQLKLSYEMWEQVLDGNDVNKFFNSSLNIFLRI